MKIFVPSLPPLSERSTPKRERRERTACFLVARVESFRGKAGIRVSSVEDGLLKFSFGLSVSCGLSMHLLTCGLLRPLPDYLLSAAPSIFQRAGPVLSGLVCAFMCASGPTDSPALQRYFYRPNLFMNAWGSPFLVRSCCFNLNGCSCVVQDCHTLHIISLVSTFSILPPFSLSRPFLFHVLSLCRQTFPS